MRLRAPVVIAAILALIATPIFAASLSTVVAPGDTATLTCETGFESVNVTPKEVVALCTAVQTATPVASATATPTPTLAPTLAPTPLPTVAPTLTPTVAPTPTPAPPTGSIVGYGSATVGGNAQPVERPATLAALRTALSSCPCNIQLPETTQVWDLNGANLVIGQNNTTLDGGAIIFKDGGLDVRASQVILRDIRGRAGDAQGNGGDLDAVNVNARGGRLSHIVWDRVEAIWGPDVSGVILGAVSDMTIQNSIIGEGLFHSTHPESNDADGHSLAFNVTQLSGNIDSIARLTIHQTAFVNSQGRNPQIADGGPVDIVDSVIFGPAELPQGNPHRGLNLVGNVFIKTDGRTLSWSNVFRGRVHTGGAGPQTIASAVVYAADNRGEGFTLAGVTPSSMGRSTPLAALSVASQGSATTLARVINAAGAQPRDATTNRLLADLWGRSATYRNGTGYPAPNPEWPQ